MASASTSRIQKNSDKTDSPKILTSDFLSDLQISDLINENIHGVQKKLEEFLNFQELPTSLKEAILLDYYTSGFWWAKGKNFTVPQLSKFMALLEKLLHNLETLHASLEDSIKFLGEAMAEIGPNTIDKPYMNVFNVQQANEIIDYLKMSLFQHYKLYEFLFFSPRDEIVIGTEKVIELVKSADSPFPDPLEEGIPCDIYSAFIVPPPTSTLDLEDIEQVLSEESPVESEATEVDPLANFTIEEVKTVLGQITDEVISSIQAEINEKLQMQEETFNVRIEKLKQA
ncbi:ciliary-associated calcium-binding coiled-coil protein 1 isoform X1 [Dromiciops gliroides]|uniref:ciliary-associated calcium-binding coiled-coil protein 1 isoform X1 n=1 Tax=Dromiciops gliroides TaxID=33562 RepID=UPI001CC4355B|nr:ciliary-associated calcium-binding coiled-coil protein 1 isoform X1 [Dromiciops gliroides]